MQSESQGINVLLQIYSDLRKEILQSISLQHRSLIAETFFISIIFSLQLMIQKDQQSFINYIVLFLPPCIIGFTALWLIEQSRMMIAGNYLQIVEDLINQNFSQPYLTWENWLRAPESDQLKINKIGVHFLHHFSQVLIIILFHAVALVSIWMIWNLSVIDELCRHIIAGFYVVLIFLDIWITLHIIMHKPGRENKEDYCTWENNYQKELQSWNNNYQKEFLEDQGNP